MMQNVIGDTTAENQFKAAASSLSGPDLIRMAEEFLSMFNAYAAVHGVDSHSTARTANELRKLIKVNRAIYNMETK
jgi:hypothetical protein